MKKSIIIFILLVIDQISKYFASLYLQGKSINVVNNILELTFVRNTGGAWGILGNYPMLFVVLIPLIILLMIILTKRIDKNIEIIAWSMIIGGAIGNYIDRIIRGYVVDFINIHWLPVFNFADMCIVLGCLIIIGIQIFTSLKQRNK